MAVRAFVVSGVIAAFAAAAACAQEADDVARGWRVGGVYRVHVQRSHVESLDVQYPEVLRLPGRESVERFGYRFRYLDQVVSVGRGQVTELLRHYVKAARVEGDHELQLELEGRRLRILLDGRGGVSFARFDGTELDAELERLAWLSLIPAEPTEFGRPRDRSEALVRVQLSNTWPGGETRSWPRIVTRSVQVGWAPEINQGHWKTKFEGSLEPEGIARLDIRLFGNRDTEEDGVPIVEKKGRELEVRAEISAAEDPELPLSAEEALQEVRDLIAADESDQARERYRHLEERLARTWPEHLQAELREVGAALH